MIMGLIPARGGSKRCPGKNIRPLGGVPLLAWSIAAGVHSAIVDFIVVSSDDERILSVARRYGAIPLERPVEMATDEASPYLAMMHALERYECEAFCLLQPTSPFRQPIDIDKCFLAMLVKAPAAVTVTAGEKVPNGAVYAARPNWLLETLAEGIVAPFDTSIPAWSVMPAERSLDINTEEDFALAERMLLTEVQ